MDCQAHKAACPKSILNAGATAIFSPEIRAVWPLCNVAFATKAIERDSWGISDRLMFSQGA
jgi:hypothetical protein